MKALFCTDGSEISFFAIENIQSYCKNLEVDILCVIDWHFYPVYTSYPEQDYINTYEEMADKVLELASTTITNKGYKIGELKKAWGIAGEEILKHANKNKYDLIILGSHGKKGIKSWIGSVSRNVVNKAKEPLFISKEPSINKKILLTADGSEGSKFAIKQALSLLNLKDKEIYVITVMEDITNLPLEITSNKEWFNDYLKKRNCFAQNVLRETGAMLKTHNLTAKEELMLIGPPSSTIIDTIKKEKIDLVVLGSRSKDRFSEFLLGSTSKRVLENVKSSVLIIAPQDTTETTSSEHTQEKY